MVTSLLPFSVRNFILTRTPERNIKEYPKVETDDVRHDYKFINGQNGEMIRELLPKISGRRKNIGAKICYTGSSSTNFISLINVSGAISCSFGQVTAPNKIPTWLK